LPVIWTVALDKLALSTWNFTGIDRRCRLVFGVVQRVPAVTGHR
jgi:hypothetical protein